MKKTDTTKTAEREPENPRVYRSAPPGLPAKEWHFPAKQQPQPAPEQDNTITAPKGVRDKYYKYFGCSEAEYKAANPAPEQGEHSPLPWQYGGGQIASSDTTTIAYVCGGQQGNITANHNGKYIMRAVNAMPAAEALAELCRRVTSRCGTVQLGDELWIDIQAGLRAWKETQS